MGGIIADEGGHDYLTLKLRINAQLLNALCHIRQIKLLLFSISYNRQHLVVDEAIGGEGLLFEDVVALAFEISDGTTCFLHNEIAGSYVPRTEVVFPKSVETATGYPAQVQGGRAKPATGEALQNKTLEHPNGMLIRIGPCVRESCNQACFFKITFFGHGNGFAIEGSALAFLCHKFLVHHWVVHDAQDQFVFVQ